VIEYQKVLSSLGVEEALRKCASGEIPVPLTGAEAPPYWYGFPPALIPLWSQGGRPKYFGIWKHWFVDREPTFVEMYVAADRLTIEIARSSGQLLCFATISAIVEQDGLTADIRKFARLVGVENLDEINDVSLASGDNPSGFSELSQFRGHVPLNSIVESSFYDGEFPLVRPDGSISGVESCCEFEMNSKAIQRASKTGVLFPWQKNGASRADWFAKALSEGRIGEAWLALNSRGWSIQDARLAIAKLAETAGDPQFNVLASAWLSASEHAAGGY